VKDLPSTPDPSRISVRRLVAGTMVATSLTVLPRTAAGQCTAGRSLSANRRYLGLIY
jgi:hypothetical protein